jgi:hypothetical protein
MSTVTTDDCKNFLNKEFNLTSSAKLKRLTKYKDSDGLYIREFSDISGNIYMVKELADGSLIVHNGNPNSTAKDPTEFDGSKFVKSALKKLDADDDYDFVENTINQIKSMPVDNQTKIANEFCFYFPDLIYANDISTVNNGLDTSMFENDGESYCIFMYYRKRNEDTNEYITDILRGILPDTFDKCDEEHFVLTDSVSSSTIREIVSLLEGLGFVYKNDKNADPDEYCMLKKLKLK